MRTLIQIRESVLVTKQRIKELDTQSPNFQEDKAYYTGVLDTLEFVVGMKDGKEENYR